MCVLLILALVWTIKNLLKAKDDRLGDQTQYATALKEINLSVRDLTVEMNKSANDTANEVLRSNESIKASLVSLEKSNEKMARDVDDLRNEQVRFGAALTAGRGF
jgi:hypothetical protein